MVPMRAAFGGLEVSACTMCRGSPVEQVEPDFQTGHPRARREEGGEAREGPDPGGGRLAAQTTHLVNLPPLRGRLQHAVFTLDGGLIPPQGALDRQEEPEGAAAPLARLTPDGAAEQLDEPPAEGEAKP